MGYARESLQLTLRVLLDNQTSTAQLESHSFGTTAGAAFWSMATVLSRLNATSQVGPGIHTFSSSISLELQISYWFYLIFIHHIFRFVFNFKPKTLYILHISFSPPDFIFMPYSYIHRIWCCVLASASSPGPVSVSQLLMLPGDEASATPYTAPHDFQCHAHSFTCIIQLMRCCSCHLIRFLKFSPHKPAIWVAFSRAATHGRIFELILDLNTDF